MEKNSVFFHISLFKMIPEGVSVLTIFHNKLFLELFSEKKHNTKQRIRCINMVRKAFASRCSFLTQLLKMNSITSFK